MQKPWVVMKFGGTSVAGVAQWQGIATLVARREKEGFRVLLVCSALAGVTDLLDRAALLESPGELVQQVITRHRDLATALQLPELGWLHQGARRIEAILALPRGLPRQAMLMSMGEWLSTQLGAAYLGEKGVDCQWVDACEALSVTPEDDLNSRRAWLAANCRAEPDPTLAARWEKKGPVLICQGFVARAPDGRAALLGRGGSDTSAALLGARLSAERVEIWTDVPGLYSADPRLEPAAKLIPQIAWDEALEMAASGARVIHGRSIRAAAAGAIPLWIKDLAHPDAPGTVIERAPAKAPQGVRAVILQTGILVLLLENLDTRQQVGFLAGVFERISQLGVSVDQVATSETTTTLAINTRSNALDESSVLAVQSALEDLCKVQAFPNRSCLSLVGHGARLALAELGVARELLREHPVYMLSQSANDLSMSLVLDARPAEVLAQRLHQHLVTSA